MTSLQGISTGNILYFCICLLDYGNIGIQFPSDLSGHWKLVRLDGIWIWPVSKRQKKPFEPHKSRSNFNMYIMKMTHFSQTASGTTVVFTVKCLYWNLSCRANKNMQGQCLITQQSVSKQHGLVSICWFTLTVFTMIPLLNAFVWAF